MNLMNLAAAGLQLQSFSRVPLTGCPPRFSANGHRSIRRDPFRATFRLHASSRIAASREARLIDHSSAGKGNVIFRVRGKLTPGMNSATPTIVKRRGVGSARKSEATPGAMRALASDNRALVEYQGIPEIRSPQRRYVSLAAAARLDIGAINADFSFLI